MYAKECEYCLRIAWLLHPPAVTLKGSYTSSYVTDRSASPEWTSLPCSQPVYSSIEFVFFSNLWPLPGFLTHTLGIQEIFMMSPSPWDARASRAL